MSENGEFLEAVFLLRIRAQGPDHPDTATTLRNVMHDDVRRSGRAAGISAALPEGVTAEGIRLDGDHVDLQVDLIQDAISLQQQRTDDLGPDDPRTMIATSYLAFALAFADHVDGQLESAAVLAQDAYEGISDAALENDPRVGPHYMPVAELVHEWIEEKIDQGID